MNTYSESRPATVAGLGVESRSVFITRTYCHLMVAIAAFIGIEIFLFMGGLAAPIAKAMLGTSWLLVLGGFVLVSWLARKVAHSSAAIPLQYLALGGYVVAEAIIFVPLLFMANYYAPGTIASAAVITAVGFCGLSAVVFLTRKDFSFMRGILFWGGMVALLAIVGGAIFGYQLGTFFSVAMVALAGGAILYDTSNILLHYPEDRYVAASLDLFASVALMFWYVLRLLMGSRR
ncbi:MAG: Bax inhibitor-1 family protein [Verrucomicrobiota bacterium]